MEIMDVTLRDGGYITNHSFSLSDAEAIVDTLDKSGISLIEIGYFRRKNALYKNRKGAIVSDIEYINALTKIKLKDLIVMVRPGDTTIKDYQELVGTGVSGIRFPFAPEQMNAMLPHIAEAKRLKFKVAINITRASENSLEAILDMGIKSQELGVHWFYVADSNGSLFPDQVARIFEKLANKLTIKLGFHPHDGLSMAFANALAAFKNGASIIDASLGGLGKGGNLMLELITMYLNGVSRTNFDIPALFQATYKYIMPWLGESCLIKNENAAASILNINLDKLLKLKEKSVLNKEPMWSLLSKEVRMEYSPQNSIVNNLIIEENK